MKARLQASGTLVIESENELEAFAIKCWVKESATPTGTLDSSKLIVIPTFPAPTTPLPSMKTPVPWEDK